MNRWQSNPIHEIYKRCVCCCVCVGCVHVCVMCVFMCSVCVFMCVCKCMDEDKLEEMHRRFLEVASAKGHVTGVQV